MRRQSKQDGFSVMEALIIVAAISIIGATGWFAYQHHRAKLTSAASTTSHSVQHSQIPMPMQPSTVTYLDIKEWGVKLPLLDGIKDAYYVVSNGSVDANGQPNTLWLGLKSLDNAGCAASLGNSEGANAPIGALGRALPTDHEPVNGELYTQLYPGTTIGDYYYFYISDTQGKACASPAILQSIDSSFAAAVKGATSSTATAN